MNNYIEDFIAGKIWIHIRKDEIEYVQKFSNMAPDIKFCSGDDLTGDVMIRALRKGEAWFRYDNGVSYNTTYPRKSEAWHFAPELYFNGEIVDIIDVVNQQQVVITEDDLVSLLR